MPRTIQLHPFFVAIVTITAPRHDVGRSDTTRGRRRRPLTRARQAALLGCLSTILVAGVALGGGQKTETAYHNFPEVPSSWYATGCCEGATIAEDIQVASGTEGMRLAEILLRLYVDQVETALTLHVFHHDEDSGLPGELLGTKLLDVLPPDGYQVVSVNVWDMSIRVPPTGRLWIAVYAPGVASGWNIADAEPSTGSSGNYYARDGGDGFALHYPFDEVEFINLMLRVEVLPEPCPADLNGDNHVDVDDLITVVLDWGCTDPPSYCAGDVNADGLVNVDDLVAVILAWGNCLPV